MTKKEQELKIFEMLGGLKSGVETLSKENADIRADMAKHNDKVSADMSKFRDSLSTVKVKIARHSVIMGICYTAITGSVVAYISTQI